MSAASAEYIRSDLGNVRAVVIGRHLFDITNGWNGVPAAGDHIFVVTHQPPTGWEFPDAPFTFVTDGVTSAIEHARAVAGDGDVSVTAGDIGGQALEAGLVDEVHLSLVPVLFGSGKRFFGSFTGAPQMLENPQSSRAIGYCTSPTRSADRDGATIQNRPPMSVARPARLNTMSTFVLIPGAASDPWYWHLLDAELRHRGHDVVAVDLPCEDDTAGLTEYTDAAVAQIGDRADLVVVAHSFGGFTGPLVCERRPVRHLVLLTAMVPAPGEAPADWWAATGHATDPSAGDDEVALFMHDIEPALAAEALRHGREQSDGPMAQPWPLTAWPDVPTTFLLCSDDRFFPAEFQRRVVREWLGIEPVEMAGSHHPMLSRPAELAEHLQACLD
ncbi:MAG: alpha/beta fold hydrolase [Pseudonocardiaceae bacterium]